jgi:hypothetical protein
MMNSQKPIKRTCSICVRIVKYFTYYVHTCGPGSSVGIATDYGLDDPGSNPGRDEIFRQSRPALGPTKPPVQWVPVLFRGQSAVGATVDHSLPSRAAVMEE